MRASVARCWKSVAMAAAAAALAAPASAMTPFEAISLNRHVSVVHKPKKQSTGSWKKNRETHQNLNKQKKEKKWHKTVETPGQHAFRPKKHRK